MFLCILVQIWIYVFLCFFNFVKIDKLIFLKLDADVVFLNIILLAMLAYNMPSMYSICHVWIFC